jgi:hypothetical protein
MAFPAVAVAAEPAAIAITAVAVAPKPHESALARVLSRHSQELLMLLNLGNNFDRLNPSYPTDAVASVAIAIAAVVAAAINHQWNFPSRSLR